MSPDSLRIIISANAELSSFINHASAHFCEQANAEDIVAVIEAQLPTIVLTVQKAGKTIASSTNPGNLDHEARTQIDTYARHLQQLKTLLSPLLDSARARRQRLSNAGHKIRKTRSWLSTLEVTQID